MGCPRDLFFQLAGTHVCNFADDTTLNACDIDLQTVLHDLEDSALTAIISNSQRQSPRSPHHLGTVILGGFTE